MSFIFSQVNPSHIGEADQPIPATTFYGAALDQGIHDSALASIYRMSEYHWTQEADEETNPMIKAADANHYAQQSGLPNVKFDKDVTMDEMTLVVDRQFQEQQRQLILSAGMTDGWRTVGSIGAGFVGSILNPLDLALNFVPIVGTGTKAANATKGGLIARAMTRGIVKEETLQASGLALKGYTAAMIEGSVGNAITEIPLMFSNKQDQTEYTAGQFGMAVGLGALFGGVINTGRLALKHAFKAHARLSPETKALEDFTQGRPIDPGRLLYLDESVRETQMRISERTQPKLSPNDPAHNEAYKQMLADYESQGPDTPTNPFWERANKLAEESGLLFDMKGRIADPALGDVEVGTFEFMMSGFHEAAMDPVPREFVEAKLHQLDTLRDNQFPEEIQNVLASIEAALRKKLDDTPEYAWKETYPEKEDDPLARQFGESEEDYLTRLYDEQVAAGETRPPTPEEQLAQIKQQAAAYKAHEDNKQARLEADREKEIADGSTLDDPTVYHFGDTVDESEISRLDEEIAELEAELDFEEFGDFELDPRISGDVKASATRVVLEAVHGGPKGIISFDAEKIKTQDGGAGFYFSTAVHSGHAEQYADQVNGQVYKVKLTLNRPYYSPTAYTNTPSSDINVWKSTIDSIRNLYGLTDNEVKLFTQHFGELTLNMLANPHEFAYRVRTLEARDIFSSFSQKVQSGIITMRKTLQGEFGMQSKLDLIGFLTKHDGIVYKDGDVVTVLNPSQIEFIRSDFPAISTDVISFRRWQAFLPEPQNMGPNGRYPDRPEYTAGEIAYATIELNPDAKPVLDEMFELDPDLKNLKISYDYDLYLTKNAAGMYYGARDTISLDPSLASPHTVVHELAHAQVVRRLRNDMDAYGELGTMALEGTRYLSRLDRYAAQTDNEGFRQIVNTYLEALNFIEDMGELINPDFRRWLNNPDFHKNAGMEYGFSNIDEFIAEGLSNPEFQAILNNMPGVTEGSLLTKFINAVKKMLGIDVQEGSALASLLDGYEKAIKQSKHARSDGGFLNKPVRPRASQKHVSKQLLEKASTCLL
jgi:hypothetical protein